MAVLSMSDGESRRLEVLQDIDRGGLPVRAAAHLLLQTRTRTLDGTLRPLFDRWYPGLANDNAANAEHAA